MLGWSFDADVKMEDGESIDKVFLCQCVCWIERG